MIVWFGLAGFILGTVLGSFALVLADRSLTGKSFRGRSYCPKCKHKLAWYDLFPILSWIILKGKCRYCHKKIGIEYLLVEVVMGILTGFLFSQNISFFIPALLDLLFKTFFIVILAILFLTDLKRMFIPNRIIKPAILIGIISLFIITLYKIGYLYYYLSLSPIGRQLLPPYSDYFQRHAIFAAQPFLLALIVGLLIGGFFWSIIIITRGKGMGGGDVWLGAFIGIMLGFPMAVIAMVLSFFIGAIFSIGLVIVGKKHFGQVIPFGPFMVMGSLLVLFWGDKILNWYLSLQI